LLSSIFFKSTCLVCGKVSEIELCDSCINQFQKLPKNTCPICKNLLKNNICYSCKEKNFKFKKLIALGVYTGILKVIISNFKFAKIKRYKEPLGFFLAEKIKQEFDLDKIDYIIPVPLHKEKLKERGFNQSELLAKKISKLIKKPCLKTLNRIKNTLPQYSLSPLEKIKNIKDAFELDIRKINLQDKNILIIDDIFTTGSTVQEMCKVLLENGVKDIYVAVLTKTLN